MEDEASWVDISERVGIWRYGLVALLVIIIGFVILRLAMGAIADRRTRRIFEKGMKDEDDSGKPSRDGEPPSSEPGTPPKKSGDGETR